MVPWGDHRQHRHLVVTVQFHRLPTGQAEVESLDFPVKGPDRHDGVDKRRAEDGRLAVDAEILDHLRLSEAPGVDHVVPAARHHFSGRVVAQGPHPSLVNVDLLHQAFGLSIL